MTSNDLETTIETLEKINQKYRSLVGWYDLSKSPTDFELAMNEKLMEQLLSDANTFTTDISPVLSFHGILPDLIEEAKKTFSDMFWEITTFLSDLEHYRETGASGIDAFTAINAEHRTHHQIVEHMRKLTHSIFPYIFREVNLPSEPFAGVKLSYTSQISDYERVYMEEAETCAKNGCFRAAIILGWNAAIDRIYHVIFSLLQDNAVANKFSSSHKRLKGKIITKIDHLREIPDSILLVGLKGLDLIEQVQFTLLDIQRQLRNSVAHPNNVNVSQEKLIAFFQDLRSCIFENQHFII